MDMTTSELATYGGLFFAGLFSGLVAYFRKNPLPANPPVNNAALTAIEFGTREQFERLIELHNRMVHALEVLSDKRSTEIAEIHQELLDRLDSQEQELRKRRPAPRRRSTKGQ
jgi:hypothetical protein